MSKGLSAMFRHILGIHSRQPHSQWDSLCRFNGLEHRIGWIG